MAVFKDLSPLTYFGKGAAEVLVAVGWLGRNSAFTRSDVDFAFMTALVTHLQSPWQPVAAGGFHRCELCRLNEAPPSLLYQGTRFFLGSSNLFIPNDGKIFCAPSLSAHSIDAHDYRPPGIFMQAVLACPPMTSMAYRKRLLACGGGQLLPSRRAAERGKNVDGEG
ncbi:hypothetical protein GO986_14075 [Deinococcus sp. HMF7620]|uniref:DUF7919 domain-containing protein n=1 Tax=Deinococcus arboris TaxID=2682977 RepID=A0A7C9M7H1_9DEIO|nr:hypothetical protein [Deinococcus arboris]MVN87885.1 hypothetical protein [Deinococcus arboris]